MRGRLAPLIGLALVGCGTTIHQTITIVRTTKTVQTPSPAAVTITQASPAPRATRAASQGPAVLGARVENVATSIEARFEAMGATRLAQIAGGGRACTLPTSGVLIDQATPGGAAALAGLKGGKPPDYMGGDVIIALNGAPIPDSDVLLSELAAHHPGDTVQITVTQCDGISPTFPVTLGG